MSFRLQKLSMRLEGKFLIFQELHTKIYKEQWDSILEKHTKKASTKRQTDRYIFLLLGYTRYSFRYFGSYLGFPAGLDDFYIQLILKRTIHLLSLTKELQAITQLKIFQRPYNTWGIKFGACKLNKMILS